MLKLSPDILFILLMMIPVAALMYYGHRVRIREQDAQYARRRPFTFIWFHREYHVYDSREMTQGALCRCTNYDDAARIADALNAQENTPWSSP